MDVDRYRQTRQPEIRYLLTRSQIERMDEVERIIKVLLEKDEQAMKNIGDPSVFIGVFEAEEEVTAKAIEVGVSAADFSQQLDQNVTSGGEFNVFDWFENDATNADSSPEVETTATGTLLSLFSSTFKYAITALQSLKPLPLNLNINETDRFIELQLPAELERRYERLPREIRPTGLLHLTDPTTIKPDASSSSKRNYEFITSANLLKLRKLCNGYTKPVSTNCAANSDDLCSGETKLW